MESQTPHSATAIDTKSQVTTHATMRAVVQDKYGVEPADVLRLEEIVDILGHCTGRIIVGRGRPAECGVTEDRVINTSPAEMLLSWSA
jgi:hypothetical protein